MPLRHHVHLSVYPLGSSEPTRVLSAIREAWLSPAWVNRRQSRGAWLLEIAMEAELPEGKDQAAFTQHLSIAIWRQLGRYVKVAVEATAEESDSSRHCELGRGDYLKLMRTS